jgi:hypothetical protein
MLSPLLQVLCAQQIMWNSWLCCINLTKYVISSMLGAEQPILYILQLFCVW